jgi:hypothetical protein
MRGKPVVAFFAAMSLSAAAQSLRSSEFTVPEAVYYANAYSDHYGVPRELSTCPTSTTMIACNTRKCLRLRF